MDLELKWRDLTWFEVLGRATATHEEALETAIPEYCPDMNRIVDATGQLQIRDREITGGAVMVSGMVSVRVLYSSEESSGLRSLEVSVPFRCTQEGGNLAACRVLRAEGRLLLTEAKAVSARRLYVRVLPEVTVTGYGEMHGAGCAARRRGMRPSPCARGRRRCGYSPRWRRSSARSRRRQCSRPDRRRPRRCWPTA